MDSMADNFRGRLPKRQKKTNVVGRKHRLQGKLANFMTIPLDIFVEICTYIQPIDLLNLARTSKRLRELLMSKSSRTCWRVTLQQFPTMPTCPTDLSEPQYIELLFGKCCFICGGGRSTFTYYRLRLRICTRCSKENLISEYDVYRTGPITYALLALIPHIIRFRRRRYYNKAEVLEAQREDSEQSTSELREVFRRRLQDKSQAVYDLATKIEEWDRATKAERAAQQQEASQQHADEIKTRLMSDGWEACDFPGNWSHLWRKHLFQPRQVTDESYRQMRPVLISLILPNKEDRLRAIRQVRESEIEELFVLTTATIPMSWGGVSLPSKPIFEIPAVKNLLESTLVITEQIWLDCSPDVRKAVAEMWVQLQTEMVQMLHRHPGAVRTFSTHPPPSATNELLLAKSVFSCGECFEPLWYPQLFDHNHLAGPWDSVKKRLLVLDSLRTLVNRLLKSLGEDPNAVLQNDMIWLKQNLICLCCDHRMRTGMSWKEVIAHFLQEQAWFQSTVGHEGFGKDIYNDHDFEGDSTTPLLALWNEVDVTAQNSYRLKFFGELADEEEQIQSSLRKFHSEALLGGTCSLCPPSSRMEYQLIAFLKLHVETKHHKEPAGNFQLRFAASSA